MAEHKINCPSCAQHLAVPEELAGQQVDCPACKKPMTIPDYAHAFDEAEQEERIEEPRQSPALIVGIVGGVLVFGGVGVFLMMGQDKPADGPEVASLPTLFQPNPTNPENKKTGSTNQKQGMTPGVGLDSNDPFGGMMMPGMGMNPFGMGRGGFGMGFESGEMLAEEIKVINERLAKGEPLDQYNEIGQTELMVAVRANDFDLARRLLEKTPDSNATTKDNFRQTALHFAAKNENKKMCELLIDNGARVNQKNKAGLTALDFLDSLLGFEEEESALSEAQETTAAYLKSKGGKSMTPEQRANMTPAQMYSLMGLDFEQMANEIQNIERMGLGPNNPLSGMNPFGMGMGMIPPKNFDPAEHFKEEIEDINQRLAKDEPLNQYNNTGDTELMIAARAGDLDLAKRLLEKNANANLKVNLETGDFGAGETALHIAAIRENKTMCELLYNNGALLNVKDEMGFTPLDAILSNFDTGPDPFTGKMINPKMTREGKATIAYLRSKGGKNMTAKQRADAWKASDPFMDMMIPGGDSFGFPGGMPPNPFMLPPEGSPYAAPKGRNSTPPKRR